MNQTHQTFLTDSEGNDIPLSVISESRLKKHKLVEEIFCRAERFEKQMQRTKTTFTDKITAYKKWLLRKNNLEDKFENITLSNFSGTKQIQILSHKVIEFDEKIELARQKIDKCLDSWGKDAHPNLKVLVDRLFKVNRKGMLNKNSILSLFQYKIEDKNWNQAMELIKESIVEASRKEYMIIKQRKDSKSTWKTINLNFSSIEEG